MAPWPFAAGAGTAAVGAGASGVPTVRATKAWIAATPVASGLPIVPSGSTTTALGVPAT
jgi:hypothetical protein